MLFFVVSIIPLSLASYIPFQETNVVQNLEIQFNEDKLLLQFNALQTQFNLTLEKTNSLTPPRFLEDDVGVLLDEEDDYINELYEDSESQSSLILLKDNLGPMKLDGIINDQYRIKPKEDQHILEEIVSSDLTDDYETIEDIADEDKAPDRKKKRSLSSSKVQPEILVVVDDTLYDQLGNDAVATNNYVRNFWNAVNLRFKHISNPVIDLNIAGIIIAKTPGSTPYLKQSKISGGKFEAKTALDLMGKHFYSTQTNFPIFDIVVTMTNQDMCSRRGSGSCNKNTVGYAYVGGACVVNKRLGKINSVAIVEDSGGYSGVIVAAHEIAHLLGAVHDGDPAVANVGGSGATRCSWNDGYIMSDRRRTARGVNWSHCTKTQLRHFLGSDTASCLLNTPHNYQYSLLADAPPSVDDQCRKESGGPACFHDSRVCTQLYCQSAGSGGCIAYHPALEGSKCGSGSVCKDGVCVKGTFSTNLPRIPKNSMTLTTKMIKEEKTTVNEISAECHDRDRVNVRGVTSCNTLLKTFAFKYCGNKYIQTICCASHALFCNS